MRLTLAIVFIATTLAAQDKAGEGVWRNYDFTPGKTVWVATDFSEEPVGRFPERQLEFVKGNMQIVELDGEKVLEVSTNSVFRINLPEELPEGFTLEVVARAGAPNQATRIFFSPLEGSMKTHSGVYLTLNRRPGVYSHGQPVSMIDARRGIADQMNDVKFQADGESAMMYVGTERAANLPKAELVRSNVIEFHVTANARLRSYIKNVVVAVGIDKLYDSLMARGEFTTRGIFFDFDSDVLRPESTPVLEEIRATLAEHTELEVVIEGHTDSAGEDAYNLSLSERRAQSVVAYLVANGIAESRLGAAGKGETEPVADNDSPEGRAQNRRVVIKKKAGAS